MAEPDWIPYESKFVIVFQNGARLYAGGIENPISWEGPNVSFFHLDEGRRSPDANALKKLDGRIRIPGPNGERPQGWITTTPRVNWLHKFFGPVRLLCLQCQHEFEIKFNIYDPEPAAYTCPECNGTKIDEIDQFADFKRDTYEFKLLTSDNEKNLETGYTRLRGQSLTDPEKRVYLLAEWEEIDSSNPFLESITIWDSCRTDLPPLTPEEPLVVALDAGVENDHFGMVACGFYLDPQDRLTLQLASDFRSIIQRGEFGTDDVDTVLLLVDNLLKRKALPKVFPVSNALVSLLADRDYAGRWSVLRQFNEVLKQTTTKVAVRYAEHWEPRGGKAIDFQGTEQEPGPERRLMWLHDNYNLVVAGYDPWQLHDMATRLEKDTTFTSRIVKFGQTNQRNQSDKALLDLIELGLLAHSGETTLRQHAGNADRKVDPDNRKLRIVKRDDRKKIDLLVALSMSAYLLQTEELVAKPKWKKVRFMQV
jgi:hypothetical protein